MAFDPTKRGQVVTNMGQAVIQLGQLEQKLLAGARDATVTDAERVRTYQLLLAVQSVQVQFTDWQTGVG